MSCAFCGIVAGKVPCHRIYEDGRVLAFLDIRPINPGHALVIPKAHVPHFIDVDDAGYACLMDISRKLARAAHASLRPERVGLVIAGFDVPHTHVHVIPLHTFEDIGVRALLSRRPPAPPPEVLAAMAQRLQLALGQPGEIHAQAP